LAAALLYFSLRGVEWKRVRDAIAGADWRYLAAASATSVVSLFIRALRWRILLNAEASLDVRTVFHANMAGYVGNNFLPARAGEFIRSFLISIRSPLTKTYVLTTALGERLMDAVALVLWSSLILLSLESKPQWMEDLSRTTAVIAAVGAAVIVVLPHTGSLLSAILRRLPMPPGIRDRLLRLADQVLLGFRAFHSWRRFLSFALATVAIWLLDALGTMIGVRAFHFQVSLSVALLLLTGLGLGSALPSTPGYVGIYQFVAVTVLPPFGVSRDSAIAYMLVAQALSYVVVLLLGLPGLIQIQRQGLSLRRLDPAALK
jgi:uncharacterized protein (TIRG00374 family)